MLRPLSTSVSHCPAAILRTFLHSRNPCCLYYSDALSLSAGRPPSSSPGSSSPHSGLPPPTEPQNNEEEERVSDREWDLRTGRAMDILQQTLPNFFTSGLVATNYHLPIHMHGLLDTNLGNKAKVKAREDLRDDMIEEGIYARNIRLEYTPPVALPAPLPRVLSVEGLPLYVTSSIFVRHALNALYTDLAVSLHKVHIRSGPPAAIPPTKPVNEDQARRRREKAIMISILVSGMSRLGLSTERAEWDVTSTYTFCPHTGRVARHTVNAIDPAPSETVYTALTSALATLSGGLRGPNREGKGAMNVMVKPKIESETKR